MVFLSRFLIVSLLLHFMALFFLKIPNLKEEEKPKAKELFLELKPDQKWQLADILPPQKEEDPHNPKFLGEYNSRVAKEEVALRQKRGKGGQDSQKSSKSSLNELYDLREGLFLKDAQQAKQKELLGEPLPEDFFPDYKRGRHTYLNVQRYPHAQYFVRLKRAFKLAFNPQPVLREHLWSNKITKGNIDVVLGVSLDKNGELAELFVFRSSGLPAYDNEALRTVRVSSPFSTPPSSFLTEDNLLRMSWTFSVYF